MIARGIGPKGRTCAKKQNPQVPHVANTVKTTQLCKKSKDRWYIKNVHQNTTCQALCAKCKIHVELRKRGKCCKVSGAKRYGQKSSVKNMCSTGTCKYHAKAKCKKVGMAITTKDAEYVKRAGKCGIVKPRPIQMYWMYYMYRVHVLFKIKPQWPHVAVLYKNINNDATMLKERW
jgi:hypothetical protein